MKKHHQKRRAEAIALYEQGLEAEGYAPGLALKFYRRADRKNTRICVDIFLVAFVAPIVAALVVDGAFDVVRPFWEGVIFAGIGILPAVWLAFWRGLGVRRLVVGGIAGLIAAWDEVLGLVARFGLVSLAVYVPRFNPYELLVSSAVTGLLMAASLHRMEIDGDLSNLIQLGKLRAQFRLGRRWWLYHRLTMLIEETKEDEVGVKQLVWVLAHQRVLYAWQISPPPGREPGCLGALIGYALNSGLTLLPYFEETPEALLNQAQREGRRPPGLREVWDLTVARTHEMIEDAMEERRTRERLKDAPLEQL